jgi:predicted nucleotidyltransferase
MEEGRSLLDLSALTLELRDLLGVKVDVAFGAGLASSYGAENSHVSGAMFACQVQNILTFFFE